MSVLLTCRVMAGGMTKRMTRRVDRAGGTAHWQAPQGELQQLTGGTEAFLDPADRSSVPGALGSPNATQRFCWIPIRDEAVGPAIRIEPAGAVPRRLSS